MKSEVGRNNLQFEELARSTSIHGVRYICQKKFHSFRRLVWFTLFLGMVTTLAYVLSDSLLSYYKYPSVTNTIIGVAENMTLPSLVICPNVMYPFTTVIDYDYAYLDIFDKVFRDGQGTIFKEDEHLMKNMSLLDERFLVDLDDLFSVCRIGEKEYNCSSLAQKTFDIDFGLCYMIPSEDHIDSHGPFVISSIGQSSGIYVEMNYIPAVTYRNEDGMQLKIKPQGSFAEMRENSFAIVPQRRIYVAITKHERFLLSKPYSKTACISESEEETNIYGNGQSSGYQSDACRKKCFDDLLFEECNCTVTTIKGLTSCTVYDYWTCMVRFQSTYQKNLIQRCTHCLSPCHQVHYDFKTTSKWLPYWTANGTENQVVMYFDSLTYNVVEQIPALNLVQLLSNFGGLMGLSIGASVLSFFELIDVMLITGYHKVRQLLSL